MHRIVIVGGGAGGLALATQAPPPQRAGAFFPTDEAVRASIQPYIDKGQAKGIVVGLVEPDGSRRVLVFGDAGEGARPLAANSVFEIGSITKTFTGAVLADGGKVAIEGVLPALEWAPSWTHGEIEARVQQEMQETLNSYGSGVVIRGVAIRQADPPAAVNDAFKEVSAAQQEAQSYINQARAYALQLTAKAQGEATAFDRIYEQYRLAPEVTRRRMYYETMERVLAKVDKTIIQAPGVMPYLPLPQAGRTATPAPAPQQGAGQ